MGDRSLNDYQKYIHTSKYARFRDKLKRRETWPETVDRYCGFLESHIGQLYGNDEYTLDTLAQIQHSILNLDVMPSMRAMMVAGPALNRDHLASYNCAAIAVDNPRVFDEVFYILMNGSGVGFSVERQFINQLPIVAEHLYDTDSTIVVQDSKGGWAKALKELIALLYNGDVPKWDLSLVRPAGKRLKTFGGRASGPAPLDLLFRKTVALFKRAAGRRLNSLECHDLLCQIADTVIVGGVRRSAMISMSNLTDDRMRRCKTGEFYLAEPQRCLANNSVMYTEKPDLDSFLGEFRSMYKSRAGERGMVNQEALLEKAISCGRDPNVHYLLNPCAEAILKSSGGLCNLSSVIVRPTDTLEDLKNKVRIATIIGTIQSTLTNFKYLRKIWKTNAEEERLLGVSLTGIMDHPVMSGRNGWSLITGEYKKGEQHLPQTLEILKKIAEDANLFWADMLGINPSKQLTLIKPEGTVSQLVDSSAGMHPRFSEYYIRKVTQDNKDPLTQMLIDQQVPHQTKGDKTYFSFPIKAPEGAIVQKEMGPIEQLELWKTYRTYWCDGNPSQTIYYTDKTFPEVQAWVWKNWDIIGGLSFFPVDDNVYDINPYNPCSQEDYEKAVSLFPAIDWERLTDYEAEDNTTGSQTYNCAGGKCDL